MRAAGSATSALDFAVDFGQIILRAFQADGERAAIEEAPQARSRRPRARSRRRRASRRPSSWGSSANPSSLKMAVGAACEPRRRAVETDDLQRRFPRHPPMALTGTPPCAAAASNAEADSARRRLAPHSHRRPSPQSQSRRGPRRNTRAPRPRTARRASRARRKPRSRAASFASRRQARPRRPSPRARDAALPPIRAAAADADSGRSIRRNAGARARPLPQPNLQTQRRIADRA